MEGGREGEKTLAPPRCRPGQESAPGGGGDVGRARPPDPGRRPVARRRGQEPLTGQGPKRSSRQLQKRTRTHRCGLLWLHPVSCLRRRSRAVSALPVSVLPSAVHACQCRHSWTAARQNAASRRGHGVLVPTNAFARLHVLYYAHYPSRPRLRPACLDQTARRRCPQGTPPQTA